MRELNFPIKTVSREEYDIEDNRRGKLMTLFPCLSILNDVRGYVIVSNGPEREAENVINVWNFMLNDERANVTFDLGLILVFFHGHGLSSNDKYSVYGLNKNNKLVHFQNRKLDQQQKKELQRLVDYVLSTKTR